MRRALAWIATLAGLLMLALVGGAAWLYSNADTSTVGKLEFDNRLKIPPLLEPRTDTAGRKVFHLELQEGVSELVPGKRTETWGANGNYLAPTLHASHGDEVLVKATTACQRRRRRSTGMECTSRPPRTAGRTR